MGTINYLNGIGCAEHFIPSENRTEYWFRVRSAGEWNGMWSKDHRGGSDQVSTEDLAEYMQATGK